MNIPGADFASKSTKKDIFSCKTQVWNTLDLPKAAQMHSLNPAGAIVHPGFGGTTDAYYYAHTQQEPAIFG